MPVPPPTSSVHLVEADHPGMLDVAYALFKRNAGDYADPLFVQLAWVDPEIRGFWVQQAIAVRADLEHLGRVGAHQGHR